MTNLNDVLDEMDDPKPWWESLGIKGSLGGATTGMAALVVGAAKLLGYEVDLGATELLIGAGIALWAAWAAWWGRVRAVHPISRTKVLPGLTLGEGRQ